MNKTASDVQVSYIRLLSSQLGYPSDVISSDELEFISAAEAREKIENLIFMRDLKEGKVGINKLV